jgi:hypothetical protein
MSTKEFRDELEVEGINAWGYGNISKMVMKDRELTQLAKLIYSYLCSYAGGGSCPFPSVETICTDLNMQDDTYFKHIKYLIAYGYITKKQRARNKGKFSSNKYTIVMNPVPVPELLKELNIKAKKPIKKGVKVVSKKPVNPQSNEFPPYPVSSGTVSSDTVKQDTNNNNKVFNTNISSLITTTVVPVVVSQDEIKAVKTQIDNTIKGDMDIDAVKNLVKNYGIERITYTIKNWEGIVGKQDIQSSVEGFFKRAVENGWKPGNKKAGGIGTQRHNFDERPYEDTYSQGFYSNTK